jgi:NADH-quinone oxidoreductase B subunit
MSLLSKLQSWARRKSPWIIHFNTGACNACDIEIVAALTPRFDVERLGVLIKGTPRHADVLVCSGPLTKNVRARLVRIYEQMAEPKFVVAVGSCACSGGIFDGCYNIDGGIDQAIPVSAYIPGCPVRPEAIIDGVVKLLSTLEEKPAPKKAELPEKVAAHG